MNFIERSFCFQAKFRSNSSDLERQSERVLNQAETASRERRGLNSISLTTKDFPMGSVATFLESRGTIAENKLMYTLMLHFSRGKPDSLWHRFLDLKSFDK